jgi:glyceraldehyde 3-phosphate dehydrogenase
MGKVEVFENRRPILGINSLGRIGKLTLWHHIGRKYFQEIVVNLGRDVGTGLPAIAQLIEKDANYGFIHRFLYGLKAKRIVQIVDERKGALLVDGVPVTILREARNPAEIPWRDYGVDVVVECTGKFIDPTLAADEKGGSLKGHLTGGAKVVINSSPFKVKNKALPIRPLTTRNTRSFPPLPVPQRVWRTCSNRFSKIKQPGRS